MADLLSYLEFSRALVDGAIQNYLKQNPVSLKLQEAMVYSFAGSGKRIRPALAFAACDAVGGSREKVIPLACALEMIHTYSLIHDDLPAMDNDDLRRGRPTNHKVFGEATAILAGDGLLTEAFVILSDPNWNLSTDQKIKMINLIAKASGAHGMVAGQSLDLESEGKNLNEEELQKVHIHKTGCLLFASVVAGGIAGSATERQLKGLQTYGNKIGLAFQIADDLLDITATKEQMGKNTGRDSQNKKATYPSIFGVEESKKKADTLLDEALHALWDVGTGSAMLSTLAKFIVERKS